MTLNLWLYQDTDEDGNAGDGTGEHYKIKMQHQQESGRYASVKSLATKIVNQIGSSNMDRIVFLLTFGRIRFSPSRLERNLN